MTELMARTPLNAPLTALASAGAAETVALRELPMSGYVALRLDPRDEDNLAAAASVIGAALPLVPNTSTTSPAAEVLWQAYDEWLLVTPDGRQIALASALSGALAGPRCAMTDVSDLRAAFELRGPHARDVLQKGCAVDLHPQVFSPGACVQTALGRVRVTVRQMTHTPTYHVLVERSYAQYLWDWLLDAAVEYIQLEPPPSQPSP